MLILPSRKLDLGTDFSYQTLLERQVTQLYLGELREQQKLSHNLTLLQLLATNQEQSAEISRMQSWSGV